MNMAYNYLVNQGDFDCTQIDVRTTHYYVKFAPQNQDQYNLLASDSNLNLTEYPLDYQIIQSGNTYNDPSLSDSNITYQYAAVKANFQFNNEIPYEILEELYIPEEDENLMDININYEDNPNWDCIDKLLDQAFIQTDNSDEIMTDDKKNSTSLHKRRPKYNPSGVIQLFDTRLNQNIGLEGVKVRARRWFSTYVARPEFGGQFIFDVKFRGPCNYSLYFETPFFNVQKHTFFSKTYWINGPKRIGEWNYTINNNGYSRFVGHVFRGAYRYCYLDIDGLQRPYNSNHPFQTYVAVDDVKSWSGINWIVLPIIKIARFSGVNVEYASDEIFSTTCHETAHTSHVVRLSFGALQYGFVSSQIQESWPVAVEWRLTHLEYTSRGIQDYGTFNYKVAIQYPNNQAYQYWNLNLDPDYTTLFINLIDDYNEFGQPFTNHDNGLINDEVTGYTISYIETNILNNSFELPSLGNQLKSHKPVGTNISDNQIDLLLSFYN